MSNIINIVSDNNEKISLNIAKNSILMYKGETYTFFDEGTTRFVYVNKSQTKVIKVLKNDCGYDYNDLESKIYQNASLDDKNQMVPTELVNGLIEQDFVTPINFAGKKLNIQQKIFALSCRNEVGWDANDNLVCFDLDEFKKY